MWHPLDRKMGTDAHTTFGWPLGGGLGGESGPAISIAVTRTGRPKHTRLPGGGRCAVKMMKSEGEPLIPGVRDVHPSFAD